MSHIKIDNDDLDTLSTNIGKAEEKMTYILDTWYSKFGDLYFDFVTSGFIEELYKDAESQYYHWANAGYVVSNLAQFTSLGLTIGSLFPGPGTIIGGVIGFIIGLVCGIVHCFKNPNDVKWMYDSKKVFEALLLDLAMCNDDNYVAMHNLKVKTEKMQLALLNVRYKINEFQLKYADLRNSLDDSNINLKASNLVMAGDDVTVLAVTTTITLYDENGNAYTKEITVSEAMNAMYTYTTTVMSGEISAYILERDYGYDVDYLAIVRNANGFMAQSINSGLYTHEFISRVLPDYNATRLDAYQAVTGATGVDLDKIQTTLNNYLPGNVALYAGLIGTGLIGNVKTKSEDKPVDPNPGGNNNNNNGNNNNNNGNNNNNNGNNNNNNNNGEEKPKEEEEQKKPLNDIEIKPVKETDLPEEVTGPKSDNVDYDALAREKFEFGQSYDEIIAHRKELTNLVNDMYDRGDINGISRLLGSYGYSASDVEKIIAEDNRFLLMRATLFGDQNSTIAALAEEMALADAQAGIATAIGFSSMYQNTYENLMKYPLDQTDPNFVLASSNEKVVEAYNGMATAKASYEQTVTSTNELLEDVKDKKAAMEALKKKYVEEFGEDTKMWEEDAVKEYNQSIEDYNEAVARAEEKMEELENQKAEYEEAKSIYETARENFFKDPDANIDKTSSSNKALIEKLKEQLGEKADPELLAQLEKLLNNSGNDGLEGFDIVNNSSLSASSTEPNGLEGFDLVQTYEVDPKTGTFMVDNNTRDAVNPVNSNNNDLFSDLFPDSPSSSNNVSFNSLGNNGGTDSGSVNFSSLDSSKNESSLTNVVQDNNGFEGFEMVNTTTQPDKFGFSLDNSNADLMGQAAMMSQVINSTSGNKKKNSDDDSSGSTGGKYINI